MYASPVPLMLIRAGGSALIEVNGRILGECGAGEQLALPIADNGDYYVCAYPLEGVCPARMRRLRFENGRPLPPLAEDVSVYLWPGGLVEFVFHAPAPAAHAEPPSRTLCETGFGPYRLTLCTAGELQLYAERDGRPFCRYLLGRYEGGSFQAFAPWMGLLLHGEKERLLLFDGDMQSTLDLCADHVSLTDAPVSIEHLPTLLGHERRIRYARQGASFVAQKTEIGFFTHAQPQPQTHADLALAFFEAVREGFENEAMDYLTPRLRESLRFAQLRSFLGPFSSVRMPFPQPDGHRVGLGEESESRIQALRLYTLAFADGRIDNITEED